MNLHKARVISNFLSSILGLILPLLLYIAAGDKFMTSFSSYHYTEASLLLLISLLFIAFNFLINKGFRLMGIFLLLIAIINLDISPLIHNIVSGIFFLLSFVKILYDKKFSYIAYPIGIVAPLIPFIGLYAFEFITVSCISIYMILYNLRILKILNR